MSRPRRSTAPAAAVLPRRGDAAVRHEHRGALRHPLHLWLEPVSLAAADRLDRGPGDGGGRHGRR
jgi:hypothetical protein